MRKIIVSNMVSIDGYFAGPTGDLDWHVVDNEFNQYAIEMLNSVDTILFGRVTYELMASYWPTEAGMKDDPTVAERMNNLSKIVFSKRADRLEWNNSKLLNEIDKEVITKMKEEEGKDMVIFGSGTIVSQLTELGLIDEYRIIVAPVVLGQGKNMFQDIKKRFTLKLHTTKTFTSGNVILVYTP